VALLLRGAASRKHTAQVEPEPEPEPERSCRKPACVECRAGLADARAEGFGGKETAAEPACRVCQKTACHSVRQVLAAAEQALANEGRDGGCRRQPCVAAREESAAEAVITAQLHREAQTLRGDASVAVFAAERDWRAGIDGLHEQILSLAADLSTQKKRRNYSDRAASVARVDEAQALTSLAELEQELAQLKVSEAVAERRLTLEQRGRALEAARATRKMTDVVEKASAAAAATAVARESMLTEEGQAALELAELQEEMARGNVQHELMLSEMNIEHSAEIEALQSEAAKTETTLRAEIVRLRDVLSDEGILKSEVTSR
jgi:hypothetical protein